LTVHGLLVREFELQPLSNSDEQAGFRFPGGCESKFPSSASPKVPEYSQNATMHAHHKQQMNFLAFVTWACEQIAKGKTDGQF
jgi:hypothetical protein